jgi:transcriptional regulator with XRE-family HTH domain
MMDDIGTRLRAARERQHLTLDQVALRTCIPARVLKQIECSAFECLPAAVFTKGHLRAYAATVGLDPENIVHEYLEHWPEATRQLPCYRLPAIELQPDRRRIVTTIVGIGTMLFAYSTLRDPFPPTMAPPPHPATLAAVLEGPREIAAPREIADEVVPAAAAGEPGLHLEVLATAECWVSAIADGEVVVHRLLQEGDRVTIDAAAELVVRIGDPAAFTYMLNGVPGRSLGAPGAATTVTMTGQNHHTFHQESAEEPRLADAAAV